MKHIPLHVSQLLFFQWVIPLLPKWICAYCTRALWLWLRNVKHEERQSASAWPAALYPGCYFMYNKIKNLLFTQTIAVRPQASLQSASPKIGENLFRESAPKSLFYTTYKLVVLQYWLQRRAKFVLKTELINTFSYIVSKLKGMFTRKRYYYCPTNGIR